VTGLCCHLVTKLYLQAEEVCTLVDQYDNFTVERILQSTAKRKWMIPLNNIRQILL